MYSYTQPDLSLGYDGGTIESIPIAQVAFQAGVYPGDQEISLYY